jgi:GDP-L-fucose synthase
MVTKKILLLGATGFVGRNVGRFLESRNVKFDATSLSMGIDLRDLPQTKSLIKDTNPDIIINCAAHVGSLNYVTEKAGTIVLDNSRMLLNMYEATGIHNKNIVIVNPVANCAYPAKADTFKEDEWWDGHLHRSVMSYGSTRRLMWSLGESFAIQLGIKSIYLLVPNMYGEFDSTDPNKAHALNALISKFVKAEKEGKKEIVVWGTGSAIREWLYAGDFARILYDIISTRGYYELSEPINIAQNSGLNVKELVDIINSYYNNSFTINWDRSKPDGAPKKVMDDKKFRIKFPDFRFTPFEKGIPETIKYYESVYPY